MAPPHKRLRINVSTSGTPLRSNHMQKRRSVPLGRSKISNRQRRTEPLDPQPQPPPPVAVTPTEAHEIQPVTVATATPRSGQGTQDAPVINSHTTPPSTGGGHDHSCDRNDDHGNEGNRNDIAGEGHVPLLMSPNTSDHDNSRDMSRESSEHDNTRGTRTQHGTEYRTDMDDLGLVNDVLVVNSITEEPTGSFDNHSVEKFVTTGQQAVEHKRDSLGTTQAVTPSFTQLQARIHSMVTWSRLLACTTLSGRTAMTAEQYEFFRIAINAANSGVSLATYKTTRTSHWKEYVRIAFPKNSVEFLRSTQRHRPTGPSVQTSKKHSRDAADCVKVVLPSEWAKLDVLSLPFYKDVFDRSHRSIFDIESAPLVRNRKIVTGRTVTLWCTNADAVCACELGDNLLFRCDKSFTEMKTIAVDSSVQNCGSRSGKEKKTVHVKGVLTSQWSVNATTCVNDISMIDGSQSLTETEDCVINVLRVTSPDSIIDSIRETTKSRDNENNTICSTTKVDRLRLYPGDYCALVRPDMVLHTGVVCLFIASPSGNTTGGTMERLVLVAKTEHRSIGTYVSVVAEGAVRNLPTWLGGLRSLPTFRPGFAPNKGTLSDGTSYVVYRLALYTDGFKQHKSLSDSRSVDGCYMLPLGNSMHERNSCSSSRVISLTPHGHSVTDVLHLVHDDLINGSSKGINSFDPFGRPVRIFLDVVSMFGDYPALTANADLRGHNATAFCTFCTFREKPSSKSGSRLHSTAVHSRRPSAMRTDMRRLLIRPNLPEDALQKLGFKKGSMDNTDKLPMLRLARELNNPRTVPKDNAGREFMPTGFDSVQSMAAAPDHMICGLIENTLEVCFASLSSNEERSKIELRMITDARENGLREQGRFLKWEGNSFKGLRSLSMSTKICMLLTSVRPFNEVHGRTERCEFLLPQQLQMFVSLVYYVPSVAVEGQPAADLLTQEGYMKLRGNQLRLVRDFLQTATAVYKRDAELGGLLNKPNAHRAIELCVHTITNFAHARNCSEMVLEMAHRKFKAWLECNTHSDSHISGMERAICADWQGRVASMYDFLCTGSDVEKDCASRCLRRLLLGERVLGMNEDCSEGKDVIHSFNEALRAAMKDPVRREMDLSNPVNAVHGRRMAWEVERWRGQGPVDKHLYTGRQLLVEWYNASKPQSAISIFWGTKASYISSSIGGRRRRTYPHLTVTLGNALSIVTTPDVRNRNVVQEEPDTKLGDIQFFAVYGVLGTSTGDVWCVVRQLTQNGDIFTVDGNSTSVLKMGERVSRIAVIHACDNTCAVHVDRQEVCHGREMCDGGPVEVVPRFDGYPPHLG